MGGSVKGEERSGSACILKIRTRVGCGLSEKEMKGNLKIFLPEELEARCLGRRRETGLGGKTRHSLLNIFKFEMPIIHSRGDVKWSKGHKALDLVGEVQARGIGSI